jgi:beta-lactamase superfamily II metal-dependent hydrolase
MAGCGGLTLDTPPALITATTAVAQAGTPLEKPLTITALRVGQGDAIVVTTPDGTTLLIIMTWTTLRA